MSELQEERWAVISERGCEAAGLRHGEAAELLRRLAAERVGGLCVVTDEAAGRIRRAARPAPNGNPPEAQPAPKAKSGAKK